MFPTSNAIDPLHHVAGQATSTAPNRTIRSSSSSQSLRLPAEAAEADLSKFYGRDAVSNVKIAQAQAVGLNKTDTIALVAREIGEDVFSQVRSHFHGKGSCGGSSNILYWDPIIPRHYQHNSNSQTAGQHLTESRREIAQRFPAGNALDIGRFLLEHNVSYGNCGEMAAMAAYLAQEKLAERAAQHGGNLHVHVVLEMTHMHAFTIIGPSEISWASVADMKEHMRGAWVVDPWLKISCRDNVYLDVVGKRFIHFDRKGKAVVGYNNAGGMFWYPNSSWCSSESPAELRIRRQ